MKIPWNKGLTKEDSRVRKYCENGFKTRKSNGSYKANSGTFQKGQTRAHYPKGRKNPKLSEIRKIMSKENKIKRLYGEKNPSWKGGVYKLSRQIRLSRRYRIWRKEVLERDNNICQKCGKRGRDVHHKISFVKIIQKFKIKNYEQALECGDLWTISNGQTLCKKCHENLK